LGLGLSFVAWIARAHQGTVRVESTPGQGSRFIVSLPVVAPPPSQPGESTDVAVPLGMKET
jgi:signal transduction histidine kinase